MVLLKKIYNKIVNYNGKVINYLSNSFIAIKYRQQQYRICMDALNMGDIKKARGAVERLLSTVKDWRMLKSNSYTIRAVSEYTKHTADLNPVMPEEPLKILICFDIIKARPFGPHIELYSNIVSGLVDYFADVKVLMIATHERKIISKAKFPEYHGPNNKESVIDLFKHYIGKEFGKRVKLQYLEENGVDGFISICRKVLSLKPDVVLYAGGLSNESLLLRHTLYPFVPTVFFFCKCTNNVDNFVDVAVPRSRHRINGEVDVDKVRIQPYPISSYTQAKWSFLPFKGKEGLVKPKKKVVSALRGVYDLALNSPEIAAQVLSIIDNTSDVVWYFIGARNPQLFIESYPVLKKYVYNKQIIVFPFIEDYEKFLSDADLYLHLPGLQGGEGSAAVARKQGVPILCFRQSDVAAMQPPISIFEVDQIKEYAHYAIKLLNDPVENRKLIELQYEHAKYIFETAPYNFYDCLLQAVDSYLNRSNIIGK